MTEQNEKEILAELKIIKKLLAQILLVDRSQTYLIERLNSMGLQPTEIADLLGTTSNTVNVALARIRKKTE